jgi:hypothetical protein
MWKQWYLTFFQNNSLEDYLKHIKKFLEFTNCPLFYSEGSLWEKF